MVYGKVCLFKDWCQLKLVGSHLVVACLARNAQFESLDFQVFHESLNTFRNDSEVVVIHLLALCRVMSHEGTAGKHQVWTCGIEAFVNEEILLFPSEVGNYFLHVRIEIVANVCSSHVYGVQSPEQRSLIVKSLTGIRDENGWDAECVVDDKYG